jgi:hypothetical protein
MAKKRKKNVSANCRKAGSQLRVCGVKRKRKRRIGCNTVGSVNLISGTRKKRTKRRKIGMVESAKSSIMDTAVIAGGAVAGSFAVNKLLNLGKTVFDATQYEGYIQTALGIAGASAVKNPMIKKAMQGVAAAGALKILMSFVPMQKIAGVKLIAGVIPRKKISGLTEGSAWIPTINRFYEYPANMDLETINKLIAAIGDSGVGLTCKVGYKSFQQVKKDLEDEVLKRTYDREKVELSLRQRGILAPVDLVPQVVLDVQTPTNNNVQMTNIEDDGRSPYDYPIADPRNPGHNEYLERLNIADGYRRFTKNQQDQMYPGTYNVDVQNIAGVRKMQRVSGYMS